MGNEHCIENWKCLSCDDPAEVQIPVEDNLIIFLCDECWTYELKKILEKLLNPRHV